MARWEPDAGGRLMTAAITLFDERGYEATTVSDIAAAAGLTRRTYFRHFGDKREVLFIGAAELQEQWVEAVRAAAAGAGALVAIGAGFASVAARFDGVHPAARIRSRIIAANDELLERELIKVESLAGALADALRSRGVADPAAELAARVGTLVYQTAFARWVSQGDAGPDSLLAIMTESLSELRAVLERE